MTEVIIAGGVLSLVLSMVAIIPAVKSLTLSYIAQGMMWIHGFAMLYIFEYSLFSVEAFEVCAPYIIASLVYLLISHFQHGHFSFNLPKPGKKIPIRVRIDDK